MTQTADAAQTPEVTSAADTAAQTQNQVTTEKEDLQVSWSIDPAQSSGSEFSSETPGNTYVYVPALPEGYTLADGVTAPKITVTITPSQKTVTDTQLTMDVPAEGKTPADSYADPDGQYTADITWSRVKTENADKDAAEAAEKDAQFEAGYTYTAVLTLKAAEGYTFDGTPADAFDVTDRDGGKPVSVYDADSHTVTVSFDPLKAEEEAFTEKETVDGVTITVTADPGVFPAGSTMTAKRITDESKLESYAEAAQKETEGDKQVSGNPKDLYAFRITVYDADGKEIEPDTSKGEAKVTFTNPDPEKWDADELSVYHVDRKSGDVDALDSEADTAKDTVEAKTPGFSDFFVTGVGGPITLYTGCGTISDSGWKETALGSYTYESTESTETFPTPAIGDTATAFGGWYSDKDYTTAADKPVSGGTYYAKWVRNAASVTGSAMKYTYQSADNAGTLLIGIQDGAELNPYNLGISNYFQYNESVYNNPYKPGSEPVKGAASGDVFVQATTDDEYKNSYADNKYAYKDLYVANVATFEGNMVRYTYYIWNRGTQDVTQFSIAGRNSLRWNCNNSYGSNETGEYLQSDSEETSGLYAGLKLRLYYGGSNVTPVDYTYVSAPNSLSDDWYSHMYDDSNTHEAKEGEDYTFSWHDLTVPANSVVVKSVLIGVSKDTTQLNQQHKFSYDADGDGIPKQTEAEPCIRKARAFR